MQKRSTSQLVLLAYVAVTVMAAGVAPVRGAPDLSADILSKTQWERMDWHKLEASSLWNNPSWTSRRDGSVRETTITLFGVPFAAVFDDGSGYSSPSIHLEAKDAFASCGGLQEKMAALFGKPVSNDSSFVIPYFSTREVEVYYQWDIGSTRVLASCTGSESSSPDASEPIKLTWGIAISSPSRLPKLIPKFALRCTTSLRFADGTREPATDIAVWVDPSMNNVTTADTVLISDAGTFHATDSKISFSVTRQKVKSDYSIDRVTGSLYATMIQADHPAATIDGKCEKVSSLGQKF